MAVTYAQVSVRARSQPLPRAFASVSPAVARTPVDETDVRRVVLTVDSLLSASIPFIHPQCWRRAAVLHRFLRLEGLDTSIVFGVATDAAAALEAHAWIERDGKPFAELTPPTRYRRVFEFPDSTGPSNRS